MLFGEAISRRWNHFPAPRGPVPAKPSWAWRLPEALPALRASEEDWIDRARVEELFGCSKTVAWRILRYCGIQPGPGGALACRRQDLIECLERVAQDGGPIGREIARRQRLDGILERLRPAVIANLTRVVRDDQALALLNTRFDKLPANVTLTPTSLHIDFFGTEDFLAAFGAVVFALNNDYETISGFLEGALPQSKLAHLAGLVFLRAAWLTTADSDRASRPARPDAPHFFLPPSRCGGLEKLFWIRRICLGCSWHNHIRLGRLRFCWRPFARVAGRGWCVVCSTRHQKSTLNRRRDVGLRVQSRRQQSLDACFPGL